MLLPWQRTSRQSQNVSCTVTLQCEHACQILFEMHFPLNSWHNMLLPWQHTFLHCQKVCFAQLHHTATMCAKFHFKCLKSVKVFQSAFPHFLAPICCYHGNTLSTIVKECISHITSRPTCGQNFTLKPLKI